MYRTKYRLGVSCSFLLSVAGTRSRLPATIFTRSESKPEIYPCEISKFLDG